MLGSDEETCDSSTFASSALGNKSMRSKRVRLGEILGASLYLIHCCLFPLCFPLTHRTMSYVYYDMPWQPTRILCVLVYLTTSDRVLRSQCWRIQFLETVVARERKSALY